MSTRKEIRIPYDLNSRMELDAKMKNQTETDWINQAIAHALACKDIAPTQRLRIWITPVETACVKCHKKIPAFTQMMYSSTLGGGLCPECYLQRWGDKGRLANMMKQSELKEGIRVITKELKEKTKEYAFLDHKGKLDQLLKNHIESEKLNNEILKQINETLKLEESYFKEGFGTDELKIVLEKLKKQINRMKDNTEKFKEQIEDTQPLVRDLQDFDERYSLERLKKRKILRDESAEYS